MDLGIFRAARQSMQDSLTPGQTVSPLPVDSTGAPQPKTFGKGASGASALRESEKGRGGATGAGRFMAGMMNPMDMAAAMASMQRPTTASSSESMAAMPPMRQPPYSFVRPTTASITGQLVSAMQHSLPYRAAVLGTSAATSVPSSAYTALGAATDAFSAAGDAFKVPTQLASLSKPVGVVGKLVTVGSGVSGAADATSSSAERFLSAASLADRTGIVSGMGTAVGGMMSGSTTKLASGVAQMGLSAAMLRTMPKHMIFAMTAVKGAVAMAPDMVPSKPA